MPRIFALALCGWLPLFQLAEANLNAQNNAAGSLQIRTVGEAQANKYTATYESGSRATRGITVQILNAAGSPVEGATVTFQLPDSGPGGSFSSGSRTEVLTTGPDGTAEAWGMQWNRTAGPLTLRVVAAKNTDRASTTIPVLLTQATVATSSHDRGVGHGHKKLWIGLALVAGASVAVAGLSGGKASSTSTTAPPVNTTIIIGSPTITLSKP